MSGTALERRVQKSRVNNDEDTKAIVFEGATINQLGTMFGLANAEVAKKIRTLAPAGVRSGYPVYRVGDAAAFLVKPKADIEAYIRQVGMKDLPTTLQKDLWAALNGQLKFEETQGSVFRSERVMAAWAEWCKTIRMQLLLAVDAAERDGVMPPELFEWFRKYIDGVLRTLKDSVVETMDKMGLQSSGIIDYELDDTADTDALEPPLADDDEL